jgi:MoaA/NifB/PqqE/SkfB family radical SAM enzyme
VIRGASLLSNRQNSLALDKVILAALRLKNEASAPWRHQIPLPSDFENYVDGWNASDAVLRDANEHGRLLYINLDLGSGCTLNCPHCFTMDGEIDSRGRDSMPYNLLKERILEAKELGLVAVRILGRGEPTEWVATNRSIETGGDFLDFIEFLSQHQIVPVVFTRGQVIGNDADALRFYKSTRRISSGLDLLNLLHRTRCSVFLGFSSIFSDINNEMVGRGQQADYDTWCRTAFKRCIQMGFNTPNPTRLAVESPITTLNIVEMPVRYVLFQLLNISPCSNVYMATGRMRALGLERISDPDQHAFVAVYAAITHFARRLGITGRIGPYPGTKECHDVSNGLYLTLNGDVYPCPGYESIQTILGSARDHTIKSIWQNNPLGRHPQSICPPKTGIHFPPSFGRTVEEELRNRRSEFDEMFQRICEGLHVPIRAGAGASRRSDEKAPNLGAKSNEVRND